MAAPTLLQGGSGAPLNASVADVATTIAKAFGSNIAAGSLLICLTWVYSATATIVSVADTKLNTWTLNTGPTGTGAGNSRWFVYSTIAGSSGADTVTVTYSAGSLPRALALFEVQFSATPAFDSGATNTGTGSTPNAGNLTPANNESFSVCGSTNQTGLPTSTAPWTRAATLTFTWYDAYEYRADNGAGVHAADWTAGNKTSWCCIGATYSCSGGGAARGNFLPLLGVS